MIDGTMITLDGLCVLEGLRCTVSAIDGEICSKKMTRDKTIKKRA